MRERIKSGAKWLWELPAKLGFRFGKWSLEHIGGAITVMVLVGLGAVSLLVWGYIDTCPYPLPIMEGWWEGTVCDPIRKSPPWLLLSGLAAAPSVLLTWFWRTCHRKDEIQVAQAQERIAQESQVTERFVAAVKLLSEVDSARSS